MKKMFQFLLAAMTLAASVSMISCNKEDDNSNNIPQADPSIVVFSWEGGEKDIAVRPTEGNRMTKDWSLVEADNPDVTTHTKVDMTVDTTSTPGVKNISNGWISVKVTDLGRQIHITALRNTTPSPRAIRFTGVCEKHRFSFTVRQNGISY